jgi:hypothetical protein
LAAVQEQTRSIDELVAHVVKHPIRIDALAVFNERVASPNEIANLLEENVSKVGHHVKELHEAGCIELVDTKQRRGAVEHFYRASLRPNISDAEWAKLSESARREISALVFQTIVAEVLGSLRAGKFDARPNRHLSWRVLSLDERGWAELVEEQADSLHEIEEIQARADARLAESGETGFSAIAATMSFERAYPGRSARTAFSGNCNNN